MNSERFAREALNAGQNLVGCFSPLKGAGIFIVSFDKLPDGFFQLGHGVMRPPFDLALADQRKPPLHLIDPGTVGRRKVKVIRRSSLDGRPACTTLDFRNRLR